MVIWHALAVKAGLWDLVSGELQRCHLVSRSDCCQILPTNIHRYLIIFNRINKLGSLVQAKSALSLIVFAKFLTIGSILQKLRKNYYFCAYFSLLFRCIISVCGAQLPKYGYAALLFKELKTG